MACFCVAQIKSRVEGHHVYEYKYAVGEELECFIDTHNKYSTNAIKVESNAGKKEKQLVGHVPEPLAKILHPLMKDWQILWMKAVIDGVHRRAREGTWIPGGGIELQCTYFLYGAKIHKRCIRKLIKETEKNM